MKLFYSSFIYLNDLFHFKIGCRMNSMKNSPFLAQWNIRIFQLLSDCPETIHHDFLTNSLRILFRFFPIISTRSNHLVRIKIGLRISNQYNRKHVYLFRVESSQYSHVYFLFFTTSLSHISHWGFRTPLLQENLFQSIKLPITSVTFWIVYRRNKIGLGCRFYPLFYFLPRSHQIG